MVSVVIAAHNEEAVIGACLDALQAQTDVPAEIIVSANGCDDRTVERAERAGVTVLDRPEPGKAGALNAADAVARSMPRIYLDADIVVPPHGLASLLRELQSPGILAAVPRRRIALAGRPLMVRAYFAINERLPVFRKGLFGRGMIALSEAGRGRFDEFPSMIADDLFLDSLFTDAERAVADDVEIVVEAPYTTRALLRRLVRVRRGNAEMRAALGGQVRTSDRWAWLRDVVAAHPHLVAAAVPYLALTVLAAVQARRAAREGGGWGKDDSTRAVAARTDEGPGAS